MTSQADHFSQVLRAIAREAVREIDRLKAERDALRAFAQDCMAEWPDEWSGLDGEQLQEAAVQHGLLKPTEATEPCGEGCWCAVNGDFPLTCYRKTPLLIGGE